MIKIGVHVSISGSIDQAVDRAKEKSCDTFQIFTRNPRGWKFGDLNEEAASAFAKKVKDYEISPPIAHMPYLPNLACPRDDLYGKSVDSLIEDLKRCGRLRIPYLVLHLGSHLGAGKKTGLDRIVRACGKALKTVDNDVILVLENTAGTKNSMGSSFEDIKRILERLDKGRVAVCLDTCHAFAAGYDLRNRRVVEETVRLFDEQIGLEYLKVVHLNDCKGELGCSLDRHEHIGMGYIGEEGFRAFLHHPAVRGLPMILETPIDAARDDTGNLRKARQLAE
ncbi:MAG: deoxyribonuclease IV [Thaumarchaeota archaeon]|nr:deoxyribonuclease IV [Nitrososphaerota archaeon]